MSLSRYDCHHEFESVGSSPTNIEFAQNEQSLLVTELNKALAGLPIFVDGPDTCVDLIAHDCGIQKPDAVILKIRTGGRNFTLILVASQVWRQRRSDLLDAKRTARLAQRRVVLVPAGRLRRPIFMSNCALLARSGQLAATATERMAVLEQISADPLSSLRDCAEQIGGSPDPYGVVLSLVAEGLLRVDLQRAITPETRIMSRAG